MKKRIALVAATLASAIPVFGQDPLAQQEQNKIPDVFVEPSFYLITFVGIIVIIAFLTLLHVIKTLINVLQGKNETVYLEEALATETIRTKKQTWFVKIWKSINDAAPLEEEDAILLDHDYDGIKELDNNLPPWWKYGFYFTIVFGIGYMLHFHVFKTGNLQIAEYNEEMEKAKIELEEYRLLAANNVDESNVEILTDETELQKGSEIFRQYCISCHGNAGEGNVGPNLTDEYWLHGGDIKNIFKVIKEGVPQKGMISWKQQLNPKQIQEVASFIKTLQGTNPPNPKEPQGEKLATIEMPITNQN